MPGFLREEGEGRPLAHTAQEEAGNDPRSHTCTQEGPSWGALVLVRLAEVESVDDLSFLDEEALGPSRHASRKPPRPGFLRPWAAPTAL